MKRFDKYLIKLSSLKAVLKLCIICDGPLSYRFKIMKRYYPIYIYHVNRQNKIFE